MPGSPEASSAAPSGTTEAEGAASPALYAGGAQKCISELAATAQQKEKEDGVVAIARAAPRRKSRAAQLEESKLLSKRHWRLAQLVHGGDEGARAAGGCTFPFIMQLGCNEAEIVQMRPATARVRWVHQVALLFVELVGGALPFVAQGADASVALLGIGKVNLACRRGVEPLS